MSESDRVRGRVLTVGVAVARSGRLASLGDPLDFVLDRLAPKLAGRVPRGYSVRLVSRDTRSCAQGARQAVEELVRQEDAAIVLTLAGTEVLPAIAAALGTTRLHTMAELLDWTHGPVPNVATVALAGGQWQPGTRHDYELAVVAPGRVEGRSADGDLIAT